MNPHDYIISVDENGSPYLEHALFGKGSSRQNHKYYTRVEDKGRWRYFYSPEEFRVWSQGGKKKPSNTEKMKQGLQKLRDAGKSAVEKAKDVAGFDERDAAAKAWSKVPKAVSSGDKKAMTAFAEANKAQDAYRKTPLGKAEYLSERAKEIATGQDGSVKDIAKKLADGTKSKFDRMKDEFKKKNEESEKNAKPDRPEAREKPEASGSQSSSKNSIDPHKVSSEYMLSLGYNSGLNVGALKTANARHEKAQSAYNKALRNPNTSSQEKDRLFRELRKAEKMYYDEADKIIDELNQK